MKRFNKVLKEVNFIVDEVLAFDIILTSVLIFLSFYLVLMLIELNPWYSLFPTLAYFIFLLYRDLSTSKYNVVEAHYAPLYEKLRTSADTVNDSNEIVDELQKEVFNDLKNVRVSSFVKIKRISYKVLGSVILCLLILFASIYNINLGQWDVFEDLKEIIYREGSGEGGDSLVDDLVSGKDGGKDDDIYGDDSIAAIGNQEVKIQIKQASIEIIGSELSELPDREFEEAFPDDIFAISSEGYEETITVENQKLVKDYFEELRKE